MKKYFLFFLLLFSALSQASSISGVPVNLRINSITSLGSDPRITFTGAGQSASGFAFDVSGLSGFDVHGLRVNTVDAGANKIGNIRFSRNGSVRWTIKKNDDAESGANAGSNLEFQGTADNGTTTLYKLILNRATGNLSSTAPCAAGYTRQSPNFCVSTGGGAVVFAYNTACTQSTALAGVTNAKGLLVSVTLTVTSLNAVGLRNVNMSFYRPTDTACVTAVGNGAGFTVQEFAAVAANTAIGGNTTQYRVESDSSGRFYGKSATTGGTGAVTAATVVGYFD